MVTPPFTLNNPAQPIRPDELIAGITVGLAGELNKAQIEPVPGTRHSLSANAPFTMDWIWMEASESRLGCRAKPLFKRGGPCHRAPKQ